MTLKVPVVGFTESDYRQFVKKTSQKYPCLGFDILSEEELPARLAILRHDIDFSPSRALALARIEAEEGVRSSYTVLLSGEYYSPFENETRRALIEIERLGHYVGLHFDAAWHGISHEGDLERALQSDALALKRLLEVSRDIDFFSFHNTTPFTMGCRSRSYAGLWNAYAGVLQDQVQYTSDSNGYWIHRSWDELLGQQHDRIQVLTHPEWWCENDAEPGEKIAQSVFTRAVQGWGEYDQLLRRLGRKNVTGLDDAEYGEMPEDLACLRFLWLAGLRELACQGVLAKLYQKNGVKSDAFDCLLAGVLSEGELREVFEEAMKALLK